MMLTFCGVYYTSNRAMFISKQQLWNPKIGIQRGPLVLSLSDTAPLIESQSILGNGDSFGILYILILA